MIRQTNRQTDKQTNSGIVSDILCFHSTMRKYKKAHPVGAGPPGCAFCEKKTTA